MLKYENFEEIAQKVASFSFYYTRNAHFIFIFIVLGIQNFLYFVSNEVKTTYLYNICLVKNLS